MFLEVIKFLIYSILIVVISKYILVKLLRKLALSLNLSSKSVGNIAGIATSVPELLTVSFSALAGLEAISVFNILSSNIINICQYAFSIILNKNQKQLRNKAIQIQLILVAITIFIPIIMLITNIKFKWYIVPIFIFLFIFFYYINYNAHKLYLKIEEQKESKREYTRKKISIIVMYVIYLLVTTIALYFVGDKLSSVLENLADISNIPELVLGIALGFITSLPELITFFESQKHHTEDREGVIEATNNLFASNVLNLFIIQSVGILIMIMV